MKQEHKRRKLRNRLALDPLLRKGGVHAKSKKAERAASRQWVRKTALNRTDDSTPTLLQAG